jgi:hypothetical protein
MKMHPAGFDPQTDGSLGANLEIRELTGTFGDTTVKIQPLLRDESNRATKSNSSRPTESKSGVE